MTLAVGALRVLALIGGPTHCMSLYKKALRAILLICTDCPAMPIVYCAMWAESLLGPVLAPTAGNLDTLRALLVNLTSRAGNSKKREKRRKTRGFPTFSEERETGFEPATSSLGS